MASDEAEPNPIKFTPEAAANMDAVLSEWRDRLVAAAMAEHLVKSPGEELISNDDMRAAISKCSVQFVEGPSRRRPLLWGTPVWARLLLLGGVSVMAVSGMGLLLTGILAGLIKLDTADRITSVLGFLVGAAALTLTWRAELLAQKYSKIREEHLALATTAQYAGTFLRDWGIFERTIRKIASEHDGSLSSRAPLGAVIRAYAEAAKLPDTVQAEIRRLLAIRNDLAHGSGQLDSASLKNASHEIKLQTAKAASISAD